MIIFSICSLAQCMFGLLKGKKWTLWSNTCHWITWTMTGKTRYCKRINTWRGFLEARKLEKSLWARRGNTLVSLLHVPFQVNPFKIVSELKNFKYSFLCLSHCTTSPWLRKRIFWPILWLITLSLRFSMRKTF